MNANELFQNRNRLFWALNISGWAGYLIAAWLGALAHEKPESYFALVAATALAAFVATIPMRYLYRKLWNASVITLGAGMLLTSYVVALGWRWLHNLWYWDWVKGGWRPEELMDYVSGIMGSFYILLCWSGLYFGIKYYQQLQEQTQQTLKATAAAHQAQLKMLRYQLNPHFLFNTLNAISTLILVKDTETANSMVSKLSNFLRYSLDKDPMQKVDLEHEINTMNLYLEIEQVRFDERLQVEIDISEEARKALVPSMLLQPLVENSIKYAVANREGGGKITIRGKIFAGDLLLEVMDDGPGIPVVKGKLPEFKGVGLQNTRERLQELYGARHSCKFGSALPHGLKIEIRIPFEAE